MQVKLALGLVMSCVCAGSGGTPAFGQKLFPVQGPLASQTPSQVFKGQIRRPMFGGPLFTLLKSWTLSNGEVLLLQDKAGLVNASAPGIGTPGDPSGFPPKPNLAFAWDAVYGQGYYVAKILGREFYQAVFQDNQGTVLQVESLNGEFGVAVDNKGNVYKMVW